MQDIDRMQDLIAELRDLIHGFDLDVHNDEANADHIGAAGSALEDLDAAVAGLIP